MKKILSIVILVILVSIAGFLFFRQNNLNNISEVNKEEAQIEQKYIMLSFQFADNEETKVQYPLKETPENLFTITTNISEKENWEFVSKDYGEMGILVTQINDKLNGDSQKYWQFFADYEQPLISVDKFYPEPGQLIEWKFIKSEL
jgi:uncharacterized protein YxeA